MTDPRSANRNGFAFQDDARSDADREAPLLLDGNNQFGNVSTILGAVAVVLMIVAQVMVQLAQPGQSTAMTALIALAGVVAIAGIIVGHLGSNFSTRTAASRTTTRVGLVLNYLVVLGITLASVGGLIMLFFLSGGA